MPSAAFEAALPFVLRWEGGFVDHPADPGRPHEQGGHAEGLRRLAPAPGSAAARRQADRGRGGPRDLRRRATGYRRAATCCERQLDLVQFDTAVNMGVGRAVRFLQQAVGCGVDGDFGPATERAVAACDPGDTVVKYCNTREAFYRRIVENKPSQAVFLKGWMNRLNSLRKEVGLPGFESARELDFGDAAYIARVPDIGEDPAYDF